LIRGLATALLHSARAEPPSCPQELCRNAEHSGGITAIEGTHVLEKVRAPSRCGPHLCALSPQTKCAPLLFTGGQDFLILQRDPATGNVRAARVLDGADNNSHTHAPARDIADHPQALGAQQLGALSGSHADRCTRSAACPAGRRSSHDVLRAE
jgi:hypothetical protein